MTVEMDEGHDVRSVSGPGADSHRRARRRWRRLGRLGGRGLVAALALFVVSPMGCYLSRAAYEEARILARRQPIARLVADDATPAAERAKLALVLAARTFAADSLGLRPEQSFTRYSRLDRDTLVLVVSAAYPDRLERRTWWFPVVGRFPYKGFFDFSAAGRTADALRRDGFDVSLGASSAFSTLGWFNDPVVSTTLRMDSVSLVNTVIHEITHTTFFARGQVTFNESFASFVGGRGGIAFFRARGEAAAAARAEAEWADELRLGAFWASLHARLDSAFAAHPDTARDRDVRAAHRERRLAARAAIYADARRALTDSIGPLLRTVPEGWAARVPLDNAVVMARQVYATDLDAFDAVLAREGHDLARAVGRIVTLARGRPDDPFGAVRGWLSGRGG
jgi:predicted aminopeptidase